jgi:transcriptional regulator with XRE-family HTH domain
MEYQNKVRACLALVKQQVKQRKLNYHYISERLNVSVLTIKRQLNGEDIAMSKLLALCNACEVKFVDIWLEVENRKVQHTEFSKDQDRAFYQNPHLLRYFIELCLNKQSAEALQKEWGLSSASTHVYLRKLEQLALITLSEQNKATLLLAEPIGFGAGSLTVIKPIQAALIDVSEKLASERDDEPFVIVKPMLLPDELRHKMYDELKEVVSRYAELSERYFCDSSHQPQQLVICDYHLQESDAEMGAEFNIINVFSIE